MLKTAAASRTQRSLETVAMGRRPSVTMVWRMPTRLSPPIWIFCRSNPAAGTSLASMPNSVPTKETLWPRVGPVYLPRLPRNEKGSGWGRGSAVRELRRARGLRARQCRRRPSENCAPSFRVSNHTGKPIQRREDMPPGMEAAQRAPQPERLRYGSSRVLADVHQHSEARQGADQAAAAVADHGERDAFGGHHPQHHAHVHEALDYHDHSQAQGEIASEFVVDAQGGADAAPENHGETEQQSDGADHAQLFAGHRVNEILVGFGEVEEFLAAAHEAEAEGAAGADGDLGLLELVVGVPGDQRFLEPGFDGALLIEFLNDLELPVEEHHNAGQTVGFGEDEEYQAYHGQRADDGAVAFLQSGDEEDQPRGGAQHDGGTEIGHHHRQDDEADGHGGGHQS